MASVKMNRLVVDFQAFKDDNNKYIIKEIAVKDLNSEMVVHCFVNSPFSFDKLSYKAKSTANYVRDYQHGLSWEDGFVSFKQAVQMLNCIAEYADELYIKGAERRRFIEKLTRKPTIDLDELHCPRAKTLPNPVFVPECYHKNHWSQSGRYFEACSLNRVHKLKLWLIEYFSKPESGLEDNIEPEKTIVQLKNEYSSIEEGYDAAPNRIQSCIRSRRTTQKSKFTRKSYR